MAQAVRQGDARAMHAAADQGSWVSAFPARSARPSVDRMPSFLVETFLPRRDAAGRPEHEGRARRAAAELTREGTSVRFDRCIYVPEDEICFFVFDAPSEADAARTAELACLGALRVVEVDSSGKESR